MYLEYEGKFVDAITISIGAALYPQDGRTGDEIIRAADDARFPARIYRQLRRTKHVDLPRAW
jgi:GGDEF domain-containing protein